MSKPARKSIYSSNTRTSSTPSKTSKAKSASAAKQSQQPSDAGLSLGEWLRNLRTERELPLRVVADATEMDLAHLQKIELGQRMPTEEQTERLARYFRLNVAHCQARRIAEKFKQDFAENPAARDAIAILAEEAGVYGSKPRNQK